MCIRDSVRAFIFLIIDIFIPYTDRNFYMPVAVEHDMVSITYAYTGQPACISVIFQPGEEPERHLIPSYVNLRSVEIGSPKTAVEFLASPVAVFRLYEPIFVDISFRAFPRTYACLLYTSRCV